MNGKAHYPELIVGDFGGRHTRGAITPDDPDSVKCTSCRMELTKVSDSVVVNGVWKDRPFSITPLHWMDKYLKKTP